MISQEQNDFYLDVKTIAESLKEINETLISILQILK